MALFPKTNPLLEELHQLDINELSPLEALNLLFSWKKHYLDQAEQGGGEEA
jgi:DNA mismatch repair protein MutS